MAKKHHQGKSKAKHKKHKAMAQGGALAAAGIAASSLVSYIVASRKVRKSVAKVVAAGIDRISSALGGGTKHRRDDELATA